VSTHDRRGLSSADFIIIIAESNFRYRQLHEQPDNSKGHAGSNARINVQCSEFVMQLARSVRRACSERGGGSRVQDERRCARPCLNRYNPDRPEDLDTDTEDHAADDWRYACMSRPWIAQPKEQEKPKYESGYRALDLNNKAADWMQF
jgi:hypothetical protein